MSGKMKFIDAGKIVMQSTMNSAFIAPPPTNDISFNLNNKVVLRITENELFYHGRKLEAEEELVLALREFLTQTHNYPPKRT